MAGVSAYVSYRWNASTSRARVRRYLGTAGQAADAGMIAALPGVWTSAHTLTGLAYLVVELDYDPDAFPSGLPHVSAQLRQNHGPVRSGDVGRKIGNPHARKGLQR